MTPLLMILSSPSGGGKTTIAHQLIKQRDDCEYSVSATTRSPRRGEVNGVDYHFISREEFEERVIHGGFLEHATYNGELYGTPISELERTRAEGRHLILDIEIIGARAVRQRYPEAILVFVIPPSGAELLRRLRGRGTENDRQLKERLNRALEEIAAGSEYDYLVVNDVLSDAVALTHSILEAESHRIDKSSEQRCTLGRVGAEVAQELAGLDRL